MQPTSAAAAPAHLQERALGQRLHAEHVSLRQRFTELMARAESGNPRLCDDVWDGFAEALERHLAFEETQLFPVYASRNQAASAEVSHLQQEHQAIRRAVFEVGVGLQMRTARGPEVATLLAILDAHAAHEDTVLYPWVSSSLPELAASVAPAMVTAIP